MSQLPSHKNFLARLEAMIENFGHKGTGSAAGTGISSNKVVYPSRPKRKLEEYQGDPIDTDWNHPRKIAYLAAYVDTFGPSFSFERFDFAEGQMHTDKANMKTHLRYGCIEANASGCFVLTEKGRALIAPFVPISDAAMEAAHAG